MLSRDLVPFPNHRARALPEQAARACGLTWKGPPSRRPRPVHLPRVPVNAFRKPTAMVMREAQIHKTGTLEAMLDSKRRTAAGENVPACAQGTPEGDGFLTHSGSSCVPPLAGILRPRHERSVSQRADRDPVSDHIVEAHGVPP